MVFERALGLVLDAGQLDNAARLFLNIEAIAFANLDIAQDDFKRGAIEGVWI